MIFTFSVALTCHLLFSKIKVHEHQVMYFKSKEHVHKTLKDADDFERDRRADLVDCLKKHQGKLHASN
jgi:hypothetical protein